MGLLQILGSGGEGYFGAKSENIRGEMKEEKEKRTEKRKAEAIKLAQESLARIQSKYRTGEIEKTSELAGERQTAADIRKEEAAVSKFDREQGADTDIKKKYSALVEILGGDESAKAEAKAIIRSMELKEKKPTSSDLKYDASQARADLGLIGTLDEEEGTLTVPCDADGVVDPETEKKLKESGYAYTPKGEVDKIDKEGWGTGDDYFRTFKLGGWTKPGKALLGGTDNVVAEPEGEANVEGGDNVVDSDAPKNDFDRIAKIINLDTEKGEIEEEKPFANKQGLLETNM